MNINDLLYKTLPPGITTGGHVCNPPIKQSCEHCWCRENRDFVSGIEHKVCCNCGIKKLKGGWSPI